MVSGTSGFETAQALLVLGPVVSQLHLKPSPLCLSPPELRRVRLVWMLNVIGGPVSRREGPSSPLNLAQSSTAFRTVRGFVSTTRKALTAACWVSAPKRPARASRTTCRSLSVNLGALGRPFGLPDWPGFQGRRFLRLAVFGIALENTAGSLFHHCSCPPYRTGRPRGAGEVGSEPRLPWRVQVGPADLAHLAEFLRKIAANIRDAPLAYPGLCSYGRNHLTTDQVTDRS